MSEIQYVNQPDVILRRRRSTRSSGKQLLLGARLHVEKANEINGWLPAKTVRNGKGEFSSGFVEVGQISDRQQLKIFYVDVGQGDATLIEAEGAIVIIDGGPNRGFYNRLIERLESLRRADKDIEIPQRRVLEIDAIIITHFDLDHYYGLVRLLKSGKFSVGKIYHNGLPRYGSPAGKDIDLGTVVKHADGTHSISTDLRDIASARRLLSSGQFVTKNGNPNMFARFLTAAIGAFDAGRLGSMELLVRRDPSSTPEIVSGTGPDLEFELLGPVATKTTGEIRLPAFADPHDVTETNPHPSPSESHTVNGNSIVLRLRYGTNSFLFGGDLNQPAQKYLEARYASSNPFKAHVNKACHHGSSDFDIGYLKAVAPDATVFSSGDDGSYDHPLPDAIGAAAKHSRGDFPLVFSTELARDTDSTGIKFGHINARSNGTTIVMAQKKEKPSVNKEWHPFKLPYTGPFGS